MNELTGVLYGLGMAAEDVAEGSKNILMISRYSVFMELLVGMQRRNG